ncbi:MAG: alpha/beta fold hydrolase [Nevskia sp.]|nr:alpha/beta fold hydrolase [Nevskia sp.]
MSPSTAAGMLAPGATRELFIEGPAGRLETLLAAPRQESPAGVCVVCHPHPLYGGEMSNKVVYALASCALKAGLLTARFNFRGVGRSEGRYDAARGETLDALAVCAWMRQQLPDEPLLLAGFSFGAYVSLSAAAEARPALMVSASVPLQRLHDAGEFEPPPHPGCPWLAVHGSDDEVVGYEGTRAALLAYTPPPELVTLAGAGHFYHGRLGELQQAVLPFLQAHVPA